MRHCLRLLLLGVMVGSLAGCPMPASKPTTPAQPVVEKLPPADANLLLYLPPSEEIKDREPPRVSKLTIDGQDFTEPGVHQKYVKVQPRNGTKTVTVVFDYWPYAYSNTIRTREVTLEDGKVVEVDLTKEDAKHPDKIQPIFYPTPDEVVDEMCTMAKVGKDDVIYDIGCGDGRLVITGVKKFGAKRGVGIDIDPTLVKLCKDKAKEAGVADRVDFREEDALKIKALADATVVLLYVGEDLNLKLKPILQKTLKPGARVVSHRFEMGDWEPDETKIITAKNNNGLPESYRLHIWTIK